MSTPETTILDESAVSEIEERANAATAGPWTLYTGGAITAGQDRHCVAKVEFPQLPDSMTDGRFIAHAREDIPALCATVKHLRAENEALRKELANSEKYQAQLLDSDGQAATLHYFKDRGDRRCVTCGNLRLWQYHTDEESDPATVMRDKCVKKVKASGAYWREVSKQFQRGDEEFAFFTAKAKAADDIERELASLTLDQVKPGEM